MALSEYELIRAATIEKNKQKLRSLGIQPLSPLHARPQPVKRKRMACNKVAEPLPVGSKTLTMGQEVVEVPSEMLRRSGRNACRPRKDYRVIFELSAHGAVSLDP